MKHVSMKSIGEQFVTFKAADTATEGAVCKITATNTVGACNAGNTFCGICGKVVDGLVGVQMKGYVEVSYSGVAPSVGYSALTANGTGGVKAAGSTDNARTLLVVKLDTAKKIIGLFL